MRRLTFLLFILALVFPLSLAAQNPTPPTTPADQPPSPPPPAKKDKKKGNDPIDTESVFNERVANNILGQLQDGLEGHSQRTLLSAFDGDKMDGYLNFEDQIEAYFQRYSQFRVHFRIASTSVEGGKGILLVDVDIESSPAQGNRRPVRKSGQLRFELEKGKKGWQIVD